MNVTEKTKDGYVKGFTIEASPTETLILSRALAMLEADEGTAEIDRHTAELMGERFRKHEKVEA